MRVPVTTLVRQKGEETGAVALMVAILSVVLIGISAFTVDFGMSYVNTRQLQTSSDAAALAAAAKYADIPGTCTQMIATADLNGRAAQAVAAGQTLMSQDNPTSTRVGYSVDCSDGKLNVTYSTNGRTPSFFGKIFGHGDYDTTRTARASVAVSPQANGRPYALCSGQISLSDPAQIIRLKLPSPSDTAGTTACPTAEIGGNWWTVMCPDITNSGHLGDETQYGCDEPIQVVPSQPAAPADPSTLSTYLRNYCPTITTANKFSCLETDTGQVNGTPIISVWDDFVANQKSIIVPVFCGEPNCVPSGLSNPTGNGNVIYPVYKLAAITICGYHWGPSNRQNTTGVCADTTANNPNGYHSSDGDSNDNFLLVVPTAMRVSGGTAEFACDLGADCDGGARRVLLTR